MRRTRELPDTRIVPFPENYRGDPSDAAHRQTWGRDHDIPPLGVGDFYLGGNSPNTIATLSLLVPMWRSYAFYVPGCRLVKSGPGQRLYLPQHTTIVRTVSVDDHGETTVLSTRTYYGARVLKFDTNRGEKDFEEAALRAARHAVAQHRDNRREPPAAVEYGDNSGDDVPF